MQIHCSMLSILLFFSVNTISARKICTISIPKCGTHMLMRLMDLIFEPLICTKVGIKNLALLSDEEMAMNIKLLPSHAICNQHNLNLVKQYQQQYATLFIVRDPRDQVVSMAHWIKRSKDQWPQLWHASLDVLITWLIEDSRFIYTFQDMVAPELVAPQGITGFYNLYLPWMGVPGIYTTTFEKLVGPAGGGDITMQCQEINNLALHVGVVLSAAEIKYIADNLFGQGGTFREGKIGSWKTHFTSYHKELFKKHGGQLLITLGYEKDLNW